MLLMVLAELVVYALHCVWAFRLFFTSDSIQVTPHARPEPITKASRLYAHAAVIPAQRLERRIPSQSEPKCPHYRPLLRCFALNSTFFCWALRDHEAQLRQMHVVCFRLSLQSAKHSFRRVFHACPSFRAASMDRSRHSILTPATPLTIVEAAHDTPHLEYTQLPP